MPLTFVGLPLVFSYKVRSWLFGRLTLRVQTYFHICHRPYFFTDQETSRTWHYLPREPQWGSGRAGTQTQALKSRATLWMLTLHCLLTVSQPATQSSTTVLARPSPTAGLELRLAPLWCYGCQYTAPGATHTSLSLWKRRESKYFFSPNKSPQSHFNWMHLGIVPTADKEWVCHELCPPVGIHHGRGGEGNALYPPCTTTVLYGRAGKNVE